MDKSINIKSSGLGYRVIQKWAKALHPLAGVTQTHAVLCNLKKDHNHEACWKVTTKAGDIPPLCFSMPSWQPQADLSAVPMQISVIVMRQICLGKGHSPNHIPLSTVMSLLGDQRVAAVELGGRFATGLITHSLSFLCRQLGHFGVWCNSTLWVVNSEAWSII